MEKIHDTLETALGDAVRYMEDKILHGYNILFIPRISPKEKRRCRASGYSIFNDPANCYPEYQHELLRHVAGQGYLGKVNPSNGKWIWARGQCFSKFQHCQKVQ